MKEIAFPKAIRWQGKLSLFNDAFFSYFRYNVKPGNDLIGDDAEGSRSGFLCLRFLHCVLLQRQERRFQAHRTNLWSPEARYDSLASSRKAPSSLFTCSGTTRHGWLTMTWVVVFKSGTDAISVNWSWSRRKSTILATTRACRQTLIRPASVFIY